MASTSRPGAGKDPPKNEPGSFREADLRGKNFEGAHFAGVDFSGARTGMRTGWKLLMVAAAFIISVALGVATGIGTSFLQGLLRSDEPRVVSLALNASAALLVLIIAAIWKGGEIATRLVLPIIAALILANAVIAVLTGVGTGAGAFAVLAFVLVGVAVIALGALVRAVAGEATALAFALVAIAGGLAGGFAGGGVAAAVVAIAAMLIGRRTLKAGASYPVLSRLALQVACRRGTRFRNADLSGADFSRADLRVCDFRGANLEGARLERATNLRMCLFDNDRDTPPRSQFAPQPSGLPKAEPAAAH